MDWINSKRKAYGLCLGLLIGLLSTETYSGEMEWKAKWITHPSVVEGNYDILHARNQFQIHRLPDSFPIHISADIRYKLFVNGKYIGQGPANNDLRHYSYDSYDIVDYLDEGNNLIALLVFSLGEMNPVRFESTGTKFIVQADPGFEFINTGSKNWKLLLNKAYEPTRRSKDFEVIGYFAMGGGEIIKADSYPWGWMDLDFDAGDWSLAKNLIPGEKYGNNQAHGAADVSLTARSIPFMDESPERRPVVRKVFGLLSEKSFLDKWNQNQVITIPANTQIKVWLDQQYLSKGHTFFTFSKGNNSQISISYAETLFTPEGKQGNRNELEGKEFLGLKDIYHLDGGNNRTFSPLVYRTWRYIEVEIQTEQEELVWNDFSSTQFIYPFQENASFNSPFSVHKDIWDTSWRTAQLCTDEIYMDCPYYEQLQYIGDTRIQTLISLYVSGDDRLMRNAIRQFAHSITDEGITQSRFPASLIQYIPPFSLYWINMLYDYHMYREDDDFTASYLRQAASILYWFEDKLGEDLLLGEMPWWNYVDAVPEFRRGSAPGSSEGGSGILTLQLIYGIDAAVKLFEYHGKDKWANHFATLGEKLRKAVNESVFDKAKGMYADTRGKNSFSQHANIFAILTNTAPEALQSDIFQKIISDESITKTQIYFRFYLHRAALHTGNGDYFIQNTDPWINMLEKGLTTFSEYEEFTRSDCHAWSSSPNFEFLHTVCGIRPAKAHFEEVLIAPNPGELKEFSGKMPHPLGEISVQYNFEADHVRAKIQLPEGLIGKFVWRGKEVHLQPGENRINLPSRKESP